MRVKEALLHEDPMPYGTPEPAIGTTVFTETVLKGMSDFVALTPKDVAKLKSSENAAHIPKDVLVVDGGHVVETPK